MLHIPSFSPTPLWLFAKAAEPPSVTLLIETPSTIVFPRDLSIVTPMPSSPDHKTQNGTVYINVQTLTAQLNFVSKYGRVKELNVVHNSTLLNEGLTAEPVTPFGSP